MTSPSPLDRVVPEDRVLGRPGLTPGMRRASAALVEVLFRTEDGPPPPDRVAWVIAELDDFLAASGARARATYRLCLLGISLLAPLLVLRFGPLRRLPLEPRSRALEKLERSKLALLVFGAKAILSILYYDHPEVASRLGYGGHRLPERSASS